MQARIRMAGDVTIVQLIGYIDFGSSEKFREACFQELIHKKVVFNLEALEFVGSSGLTIFVDALTDLQKKSNIKPKFCNVSTEFLKLFQSRKKTFDIYDSELPATKSYENPADFPVVKVSGENNQFYAKAGDYKSDN